ncbi:MAG: TIGR03067 domain-containing protein, partial [Planctomyces sp.]|nr:TIGR03067 domain-containing protein [Planctomyces sp.]
MTWLTSIGLHNAVAAACLALLVWGVVRVWKNAPAAHALWLLVLVKLVTPPLLSFDLQLWNQAPSNEEPGPVHAAGPPGVGVMEASWPLASEGAWKGAAGPTHGRTALSPAPDRREFAAVSPSSGAASMIWSMVRPWLIGLWAGGAGLMAIVALVRVVRFQRRLASTLPASDRMRTVVNGLADRMGLQKIPDVRVVDSAVAPFVWRLAGRAAIVLPLRLTAALDERQQAMVLTHELAHLRRGDHWVRKLELLVSVLYWWNPLTWWVRRQLHTVEEQCCDAWVAWVFPDGRRAYAESLLTTAELFPGASPRLAMASPFLNAHTLRERIEMVLKNPAERSVSRGAALALWLLAVVAIPAGIRGTAEVRAAERAAATGNLQDGDDAEARADQPAVAGESPADEPQLGQGTYTIERLRSDAWPAESEELPAWRWTIQGREIVWNRPDREPIRIAYTLDPTASLPRIDLTFLSGPHKGQRCEGVYLASRHKIDICFQEPGKQGKRPTNTGASPGNGQTSLRLVPAVPLPVADEIAALQGTWRFHMYYSDWWPERISDPPVSWSKWRWTVTGNEILWSGMKVPDVRLSFTLDPSRSPRQIDLTFLDGPHKGQQLLGMYEHFSEGGVHICFADPGAEANRPTRVEYSRDAGLTMVSIERTLPETATDTPRRPTTADRGPEIDAAIARLRRQGAFVREFHPRGDRQYWVQVISHRFEDADLTDVEIVARGTSLDLHLRDSHATPAGLERLASVARIIQLELSGGDVDDELLKSLPKLPLQGQLGLNSRKLTNAGVRPVAECRGVTSISLEGELSDESLEHLTQLPNLQRVALGPRFTRGAFDILPRLDGLTTLDASELAPDLADLKKLSGLQTLSLT